MLFVLTGSSAVGKTTLVRRLPALPRLAVHDVDELGVPNDADIVWRQRTLETWMQRAVELERQGYPSVWCGDVAGDVRRDASGDLVRHDIFGYPRR